MARYATSTAMAASLATLPFASPAYAHHFMGGELPRTGWQGLLAGLGHPIIGIDHFAFIVGAGLLAYLAGRVVLLPLSLVIGTVAGCMLHVMGFDLPAAELTVALTVAAAAALVVTRAKVPLGLLAALVAAAGIYHGYAYGESIVGAEPMPLGAYFLGFGIIQSAIGIGSGVALRAGIGRDYLSEATAMRLVGAGLGVVAVLFLANTALAG
ncbi:MAG TPA: HupE/UreJ family protein [Hyphomicrobiaceae bacterium]|nr:HupE/UreJ family protein [Hyphomicrobiaceae bacterium]